MADVQLENGFTRIAHELLESVQMFKFSLNEIKIIMAVWRFTYGFNRKSHEMSLTFFMNHTGLNRSRVNNSIKKLIENNVLIITKKGNTKIPNSYSFNKDYDTWKVEKYSSFISNKNDTSVQIDTSIEPDTSTSVQNETSTSVQIDTQERYFKENIKIKGDEEEHLVNRILDLLQKSKILEEKDITEFLREDINDVIETFGFEQPEEVICEAIKDAARGNGRTWKYVYKKLVDWKKKGIRTLSDLENQPYGGINHGATIHQYRRRTARPTKESPAPILGDFVGRVPKRKI